MHLECLRPAVLYHIIQMLDPITEIFLCKCQKGALLITVILCSVSACWSSIKWLPVVFLCCVPAVFFPNIDAVRFSHTKDEYVLPVTNRVRYSVLISAAEPVVAVVCSQPGQVAPVTLHRPCGTKHFFPRRTAPPTRNFADPVTLTWPEGWLMYTTWQCSPSAERLSFEPEHLKRYMDCGRWCSQTRCLPPFYPTTLCKVAFIKWVYAIYAKTKKQNCA